MAFVPAALAAQPPPQARLPVGFPGGTPALQQKPSAAIPAASQLPAMPIAPPAPIIPPTPATSPAQHADVSVSGALVTVQADNSSLNQILRSIMRKTGLKVTGGVAEERVFGAYGPAPLGPLLTSLLTGTGMNVIFVPAGSGSAAQLILSPRNGGPMPPPPEATANAALDADPAPVAPAPAPVAAVPVVTPAPATSAPIAQPAATAPAITAVGPAIIPAPAAVPARPRTAEEIVEEIMKRRAAQAQFDLDQKKKAAAAPQPATAPAPK